LVCHFLSYLLIWDLFCSPTHPYKERALLIYITSHTVINFFF
jgi:hypothetical protein